MDEEEIEAIKQSVEQATAEAAREAARADALARAARQVGSSGSSQLFDLERLRVRSLILQSICSMPEWMCLLYSIHSISSWIVLAV